MSPGRNSTGSVVVPVRRRASVSIVCAGVDAQDRARRSDPSGEGAGDVAGAAADVDEVVAEADAEQLGGSGAQSLDGRDRRLFVQRRDQGRRARVGVDGAEAAERGRRRRRRSCPGGA